MCRRVRITAGPERRDTSEVVSVRIHHAAVWFNQRRQGSGPSGNIPLLICCGKTLSRYARARPLEPGHARARAHARTHTNAITRRDTLAALTQTRYDRCVPSDGRTEQNCPQTTRVQVYVCMHSSKGTHSRPNMLIKSAHPFHLPSKTPLEPPPQLETSLNTINTFLELIAC